MILSLVNPADSEVKFKVSRFPDGQQNITITSSVWNDTIEEYEKVKIKSRLNSWLDLEIIVATVASLRNLGVKEIHLYTPYFMGARSDRKFEEGGNNYLKDVICPVINSLNFDLVTILDPHSHVLEACLNNFTSKNNHGLVGYVLDDLKYDRGSDKFILVSPDAGATHKIYKVAEAIGYKGPVYTATKERNEKGELTKQVIPNFSNDRFVNQDKDVIIIDDICDGGRTFINLAKIINKEKHQLCKGKLYLIVTHGIFSNGFKELSENFDGIYTTNSFAQWQDISKSEPYHQYKNLVKTLNIF
jgi:ribose-phosphate pyrophosphokinase